MKANLIKIEKTKEKLIRDLNEFELDLLIQDLVQYKEGNVTVGTVNIITRMAGIHLE